jgi:hypothetical protein
MQQNINKGMRLVQNERICLEPARLAEDANLGHIQVATLSQDLTMPYLDGCPFPSRCADSDPTGHVLAEAEDDAAVFLMEFPNRLEPRMLF